MLISFGAQALLDPTGAAGAVLRQKRVAKRTLPGGPSTTPRVVVMALQASKRQLRRIPGIPTCPSRRAVRDAREDFEPHRRRSGTALLTKPLGGIEAMQSIRWLRASIPTLRIPRLLPVLLLGIAVSARAAEKPLLEWGKELFVTYCASCHGKNATGSGPAAKGLNPRPADLTVLSRRNGGEFPRLEVIQFIEGQRPLEAHQSAMPRWGAILRKRSDGSIAAGGSVPEIYAITDYLASIQKR